MKIVAIIITEMAMPCFEELSLLEP